MDIQQKQNILYTENNLQKFKTALIASIYTPPKKRHNHTFFELSYVKNGRCLNVINDIPVDFHSGVCILVRPNDSHYFSNVEQPPAPDKYEHIDIYIGAEEFKSVCDYINNGLYEKILNKKNPVTFNISNSLIAEIKNKVDYIINNQNGEDENICRSFHKVIVTEILSSYLDTLYLYNKHYPAWLNQLLRDLNSLKFLRCKITDLAYKYGYTREHLSREFKNYTGIKLVDYITQQKIRYSLSLITTNQLQIIEIAEMLGYQKQSSFTANFKEVMKCTPKEFQKQHKLK